MSDTFDIAQFDSYREDNRREVKKLAMAFQILFGIHTLLLRIVMAVLFSSASKKIETAVGKLQDYRMRPNFKKSSGISSTIRKK